MSGEIPPGVDLSTMPAMAPPNGTVPNFINPTHRGPMYIALASTFLGIATLSVLTRLYARFVIQRKPWWDDLATVMALLCQGAYSALNIWLCQHGIGKHMWNILALDVMPLVDMSTVMAVTVAPAVGFTKVALLMLFYHIFWPHRPTRIASLVGIVGVFVIYLTIFCLFLTLGITQAGELEKAVDSLNPVNKAMAVLNVITDFYILIAPVPAIMALKLAKNKKFGLVVLFGTGLFCCIMSIVGARYRWTLADNGDDFTWRLLDIILVNSIENCVGIICACVPLFPAIIHRNRIRGTTNGSRSQGSSNDAYLRVKSDRTNNSIELTPENRGDRVGSARGLVYTRRDHGPEEYGGVGNASLVSKGFNNPFDQQGAIEVRRDFSVDSVRR